MKRKQNLVIAIVLSTAAGFLALQNVSAPAPDPVTQTPVVGTAATEPPITEAPIGTCAYVWAYHDAPELTEKLDAAVKAIDSAASGRAQFFGEDCVYADGHSTFGAMETDFYVRMPADDLTNQESFGNWMAQVMPIVVGIPRDEVKGNYGFVEFWFEKNDAEHVIVRVPIQTYIDEALGKRGMELFNLFYVAP
ncbi:MAG: hypothetical protein HY865_11255 [Chloroflexi bacterium]|nr:hypothetical protein [Chloroflexota bacterium]